MAATFKTLDEFSTELHEMGDHSAEYWDKQIHVVPKSQVLDRVQYLVKCATGKTVLHVGCTGPLDVVLRKVAKRCYGMDLRNQPNRQDFFPVDFDRLHEKDADGSFAEELRALPDLELIVCGEVLEHLSNPGFFLDRLRLSYPQCPVIFTVPNAMSSGGMEWLVKRGRENVNSDHVCYYSYTTLKTLVNRYGYTVVRHFWYGGRHYIAEGLIVVAEPRKE